MKKVVPHVNIRNVPLAAWARFTEKCRRADVRVGEAIAALTNSVADPSTLEAIVTSYRASTSQQ
jgi:uncharacterized protein (UPF0147 family)